MSYTAVCYSTLEKWGQPQRARAEAAAIAGYSTLEKWGQPQLSL